MATLPGADERQRAAALAAIFDNF